MTAIAYCANVHPGRTLAEALTALDEHAVAVRGALVASGDLAPTAPLPVGGWLSATAVAELQARGMEGLAELAHWLHARRLSLVALNGFPFGDFHEPVVKHRVYVPDWADPARSEHSARLAELGAALAQAGARLEGEGGAGNGFSVSTVPLGWPMTPDGSAVSACAEALAALVPRLRLLRERTGVRVHVDLEPEPGCLLSRAFDVVRFFERHLRPAAARQGISAEDLAAHVGVCHDVCHAEVMFERQQECLAAYAASGIAVGRIQVSSALSVDFEPLDRAARLETLAALGDFAETRYLHQTMVRLPDGELRFYEDLPLALRSVGSDGPRGEWRSHFHVPVNRARLGGSDDALGTTQPAIAEALACLAGSGRLSLVEVETYAWNVLPERLRPTSLAEGIAEELRWTGATLARVLEGADDAGQSARSSSEQRS